MRGLGQDMTVGERVAWYRVRRGLTQEVLAGMVSRTKAGNHARYAISDPSVFELCEQVCGGVRRQVAELDALLRTGE